LKEDGVQKHLINVKKYLKRSPVLKLQKTEKKEGLKWVTKKHEIRKVKIHKCASPRIVFKESTWS